MPLPTLLSDIGNVLVSFDFRIAARRASALCPYPAEALLTRLDSIKSPYENGEMDDETFMGEAMRLLEFRGVPDDFRAIWCEIFAQNDPMNCTLKKLDGHVPMHLLSNTSGLHKNYLLSTFSIFKHFQSGVYSYSAKCSKPHASIFEVAIRELDLAPALTLFVDDLAPNIETAQNLGFDTHLYVWNEHDAFVKKLRHWASQHHLPVNPA